MNIRNKLIVLIILILGLLSFMSSCNSPEELVKITATVPPAIFSNQAETLFTRIVKNEDSNLGITIEQSLPDQIQKNSDISFIVLNHTNETVLFPDQGFGFVIYGYNQENLQWEKQSLRLKPDQTIKELPEKVEFMDFKSNNIWTIVYDELINIPFDHVRLYVSGTGEKSGKVYGAYLDIMIR